MAEAISGKGMRRVQLADGQLHVLSDKHRVIIQLRSPKIVTETDAVSPACKIGVVLDPSTPYAGRDSRVGGVRAAAVEGGWQERIKEQGYDLTSVRK